MTSCFILFSLSISHNCYAIKILRIISFPISQSSSASRRFCIFQLCPIELYLQVAKMTPFLYCMCCLHSNVHPQLPLRPCLHYIKNSFSVSICHVNITTALLPPIHSCFPEKLCCVCYFLGGLLVFKSPLH